MVFPVSGVECPVWLPPLVALIVSSLTASAGVSGAFLLLPFQVSFLNFTSPAVSPTNLIYNIVAIPGGLYRYIREGRMAWPLTWTVTIGTLPGVFIGAVIRVKYLPDPRSFKFFVGLVLLYLGVRLFYQLVGPSKKGDAPAPGRAAAAVVKTKSISLKKIEYTYWGETFSFSPLTLFALSLAVGLVGGIYGIGGGAIIAPFVVSMMGLPIYTVAGAALAGTFITSIAGVAVFEIIARLAMSDGQAVSPDWLLGALFGLGGLAGTYLGARLQKFIPEKFIRALLAVLVTFLAFSYIIPFIRG